MLYRAERTGMNEYLERTSLTWSKNSIRLIETASQIAKSNYLYIQEAGYFETKYPYFTERQNLNSFLLVYTISGKGRLLYEDSEYVVSKGTVFFINCLNYHYYESSLEEPWEILWIHFNGSYANGYYEEFCKNTFSIITPQDSFLIESTLRRILSMHQRKDIHRELITSSLIVTILTELILLNTSQDHDSNFAPSHIKAIKNKLNKDYTQKISLDDLAKEFSMSKFYLSKEFKKYTGTTINEYLIDQRISHSKELLKYSDLSISDITFASGINNVSHFINLFKEREGITPLGFRKEWRV
jgi:AraC-like DNA-binding protein